MPESSAGPADLAKRIRLETQLLARRKRNGPRTGIPRLDDSSPVPLAPAQHRIWFQDQLQKDGSFNVVHATRLSGELDVGCLARAFDGVVSRHQPLRSIIIRHEGVVRMAPAPVLPRLMVERVTWTEDRQRQIKRYIEDMARRPFDLASDPPICSKLLQFDESEFLFVTVIHHIACDEWSIRLFGSEMNALYTAQRNGVAAKLPDLPVSYADFAAWQNSELTNGRWTDSLDYWQRHLQGADPHFCLYSRPQRASQQRGAAGEFDVALLPSASKALDALGRAQGATPFMVMLAVVMASLHRGSGKSDIAIATQVAGRNQPELTNLIGAFTNTVIVRTRCGDDPGFDTFLAGIREQVIASLSHGEYPFDRLVRQLPGVRAKGEVMPFGRVMFRHRRHFDAPLTAPGLESTPVSILRETAKFDFSIAIIDDGDTRSVRLQYDSCLFGAAEMDAFAKDFCDIASAIAAAPTIKLSQLPTRHATWSAEDIADDSVAREIIAVGHNTERGVIEDKLSELCSVLLRVSSIDRRASFFEFGGDSLSFLQFLFKIEENFSVKLTMSDVFREPTIMAIADRIIGARRSPRVPSGSADKLVTPLLSFDDVPPTARPFFLIDGAAGIPVRFSGMARRIAGEWYGLAVVHPEMVPGEAAPETLSAVVARMMEAVLAVDPAGPYLIAGYSYGGIVAYELARELTATGKAAGVVLLDTRSRHSSALQKLEKGARTLLRKSDSMLRAVRAARTLRARLHLSRQEVLQRKEADLQARLARNAPGPWHEPMMNAHRRLVRDHQPSHSNVPVVLIRAEQSVRRLDEPDYGWSRIADVRAVMQSTGNHVTFYQSRNEAQFAYCLAQALDRLASELFA